MEPMRDLLDHIDRLQTELAELKCLVPRHLPPEPEPDPDAWTEFLVLTDEVSARWSGPGAVEEIRAQRGE